MYQPLSPPVPDWAASTPEWPGAPGRGSWVGSPSVPPPAAVAAAPRSKGLLTLGVVALAGVAAGAVGGAFLVTAVFVGSAEAIGEGIGRGMAAGEQDFYASMSEEDFGWSAGPPLDPADIGDPVAPLPGADPVLDGYAQRCFEGDYQSCDDLFFESPSRSEYEDYGASCAGRVEVGVVMSCTELD
jgi:hypothetical protein